MVGASTLRRVGAKEAARGRSKQADAVGAKECAGCELATTATSEQADYVCGSDSRPPRQFSRIAELS